LLGLVVGELLLEGEPLLLRGVEVVLGALLAVLGVGALFQ
jgi:hypothetical protein